MDFPPSEPPPPLGFVPAHLVLLFIISSSTLKQGETSLQVFLFLVSSVTQSLLVLVELHDFNEVSLFIIMQGHYRAHENRGDVGTFSTYG